MHKGLTEYTFLIGNPCHTCEEVKIIDMSLYAAKKRAKRIAGAGVDCVLIKTEKGSKPRKEI